MRIYFPGRDRMKLSVGKHQRFPGYLRYLTVCKILTVWLQGSLVAVHNRQSVVEHQMPLRLLIHGAHLGVSAIWRPVAEHVSQHRLCYPGRAICHACSRHGWNQSFLEVRVRLQMLDRYDLPRRLQDRAR